MNKSEKPGEGWSIRLYREGDEEQILQLREVASSGKKDLQWWRWLYRDSPGGLAIIVLAEANGRIIGQHAAVFLDIKVGNQIIRGYRGLELMVHPDYRRQGIFIEITKVMEKELTASGRILNCSTPNNRSRPGFLKHLNYLEICRLAAPRRVIDWGVILKTRYGIPVLAGRGLGLAWEHLVHRTAPARTTGIEVEQVTSFDERIDKFWEKASRTREIMIAKDRQYLNWRYVTKPGNKYRILIARQQDEITGFIVFHLEGQNPSRGVIIDLLTVPGADAATEALVNNAVARMKAEGAAIVSTWIIEDTPFYGTFRKLGWVNRRGAPFCIRILDQNLPRDFVTDPGHWHFTRGDSDSI